MAGGVESRVQSVERGEFQGVETAVAGDEAEDGVGEGGGTEGWEGDWRVEAVGLAMERHFAWISI